MVFFLVFFLFFFFSSSSEDDETLESEEGHGDVDVEGEVKEEEHSGAVFLPGGRKVGVAGGGEMFIGKQSKSLRIYFFYVE